MTCRCGLAFLRARGYASAVLAVVVCPSVCLSQAGTIPKRLYLKQEAQLLQRYCTACHVSKFELCFTRYGS